MLGQFFYVVAHEMGHALFDQLNVSLWGRPEDAADQFAAYMMLLFGKQDSRRLIGGAAFTYKDYVGNPKVVVPQTAFADVHGAPMQRFYNLLCIAYGADRESFADLVDKGYLPAARAPGCKTEYGEINFAFQQTMLPDIDKQRAKAVMQQSWLPKVTSQRIRRRRRARNRGCPVTGTTCSGRLVDRTAKLKGIAMHIVWRSLLGLHTLLVALMLAGAPAFAQQPQAKPNILVIMGDDIGYWNISAYNRGQMGYRTPNIDRIANEGAILTDYYGQQSCTAGRAAFVTGQSPMRTGLLKVGLPGAKEGLSDKDPTLAELLKPLGYMTGQFGKNHLGDRNEFLPTVHGFDEFFGNLYHLNAEDEPEHPDYPKNLQFKLRFGPRGVLRCTATLAETPGEDPRFGKWGRQSCTDTGPLTKKRMETVDQEFLTATLDFIDRANRDRKPFFAWFNSTRMHIWTRLAPEAQGKTGLGIYPDGMVEHDGQVGQLLKKLDDLGITNNTIVIYTTDNGAETFTWPDGGTTPFRGEKNTNWEGSYRVPALVRWPGLVVPRTEINDIVSAEDWVQTLVAAAGEPDIGNKLLQGYSAGGKTFKVHLDGYDQRDLFAGRGSDKRREFFYWTDDGNFAGLRYDQYKAVFMEQPAHGLEVWMQPLVPLRAPKIFNIRSDPFERAEHEAGDYDKWFIEHLFVLVPAQAIVGEHLATFQEFPPRQKPGSFSVDQALEKLSGQNSRD